jgi:hypothetical protein
MSDLQSASLEFKHQKCTFPTMRPRSLRVWLKVWVCGDESSLVLHRTHHLAHHPHVIYVCGAVPLGWRVFGGGVQSVGAFDLRSVNLSQQVANLL